MMSQTAEARKVYRKNYKRKSDPHAARKQRAQKALELKNRVAEEALKLAESRRDIHRQGREEVADRI